jgi:hypothetical protein
VIAPLSLFYNSFAFGYSVWIYGIEDIKGRRRGSYCRKPCCIEFKRHPENDFWIPQMRDSRIRRTYVHVHVHTYTYATSSTFHAILSIFSIILLYFVLSSYSHDPSKRIRSRHHGIRSRPRALLRGFHYCSYAIGCIDDAPNAVGNRTLLAALWSPRDSATT